MKRKAVFARLVRKSTTHVSLFNMEKGNIDERKRLHIYNGINAEWDNSQVYN